MEDLIAAVVFFTWLAALVFFSQMATTPFLYGKSVEIPVAAAHTAPTRTIYVYNVSKPNGFDLIAVDPGGAGAEGEVVAVFEVYPGGYRCVSLRPVPVRIGDDPYAGLWCPPPFDEADVVGCVPRGVVSRGRWLLVQYLCTR